MIKDYILEYSKNLTLEKFKINSEDTELYNFLKKAIENKKGIYKNAKNFFLDDKNLKALYDTMSEEEKNKIELFFERIIIDNFIKQSENFIKEHKRFQFYSDVEKFFETNSLNETDFYDYILAIFRNKVNKEGKSTSVKMKKIFFEEYKKNKELFEDFFLANIIQKDKGVKVKEFLEKGEKMKGIIQDLENTLVNRMEGGQYGKMSTSVSEKFNEYIKTYFPDNSQVGLKVRKLSKEEMEKYIQEQRKK